MAYFEWFSKSNVIPGSSLQLDRYIVTIQERQVGRLSDLSGLTYSATTGTLFGVSGRPSQIVELSTDGELLRIISLDGVSDPEAIAHVAGDNFLVSDEGRKRILEVTIGERASKVTASEPSYYATTDWQFPNLGYEGLDIGNGLLYVAQEMLPSAVTVVTRATPGIIPTVREWGMNAFSRLYMLDISSLAIEKESGNVLVMSHQSALIAQYSPEGRVLGGLLLWKGRHG
ncbi:SdiA-regulated domain-containing protein, partial [Agrobacterium sp. CG674]